jgi:sec-independent protein translocase protein TatA
MGLSNPIHIAFVLVLLLLVFGAKRLPEMGRSLGSGMRGFKDSISGEDTHEPVISPAQGPVPVSSGAVAVSTPAAAPVSAAAAVQPHEHSPVGEPQAPHAA